MSQLMAQIEGDLKTAQKTGDLVKTSILRLVISKLHNAQIEKGKGQVLTDSEIEAEILKEVKSHKESIEAFEKGQRADLVEKEKAELAILQSYLPEQLSTSEIEQVVGQTIADMGEVNASDFGQVMAGVMAKIKGRADGKLVADIVRNKLQEKI